MLRGLSGIVEVFSTPAGDLYTTVVEQGCRRTLPLDADEFRSWLVAEFYAARGRAPGSEAVSRARALFETRARIGPDQHPADIGVTSGTLAKWRLRGNGPPYHRPVRQRFVLYHRDEIDIWLQAGLHHSTSEERASGS